MEGVVGKIKDEKLSSVEGATNHIVHVRENSDSELQLLFDCVLKPSSQMPLQKPFKMRNLPASFFTPPAHRQSPAPTITHSREGSADSTYSSGGTSFGLEGTRSPSTTSQQPQHSRHHSSPATLQQTLSVAPPVRHLHAKQHSCDALSDDILPHGWEQARTGDGQLYYLNHITQSTTWEDPRKKVIPSPLSLPTSQQAAVPSSNPSSASSTPVPSPVPTGVSSPVAGTAAAATALPTAAAAATLPAASPFPSGWEQGVSGDGEVYFINHVDKTTTWFDPRLPRHLQTAIGLKTVTSILPSANQTLNHLNNVNHNGISHSLKQGYTNNTLQKLQHDKEALRFRRLQELARSHRSADYAQRVARAEATASSQATLERSTLGIQQIQLRPSLPVLATKSSAPPKFGSGSVEINLNSASLSVQSANSGDPFIATDIHSRQESADSGLGLGGNYTHPHTPEDFLLTSMEDVEISSVDDMQQSAPSPMMVVNSELESMDSEELIPSISMTDDFLPDLSTKNNFHTWL